MGKVNEALKDAEQCILYNGAWEKGWGRKGAALMQKGDLKGAIEAYSKADELLPDNKATLDQLAKCRKKLADKQSKSTAPAPAAGGGGGGGGGGGASAAMQAERAGWLQKKEGKIRKKWVRYYCELKGCKLRILDSEPGGVSPRPVANIVGHPLVGCLIGPGVCFGTPCCWNTETRTPRPACASPDTVAGGVSQAVDPVQKDEISLDGGAVTAVEADGGDKTIIVSRTARSATIRRFAF